MPKKNKSESKEDSEGDNPPNPNPEAVSPEIIVRKQYRKRDGSTLRKAPQAPKRFKSSYIFFFTAKQQEIKDQLGDGATVADVSKRSAEMWRQLPQDQRAYWDDVATKDKHRYMAEKAAYTGPWQVPWKRAKKDPSAPKRPMSAFLYFSQDRRKAIKEKNPGMRNTDVSRVLGEMWRNATEEERNPHIEHEIREREKYKIAIAKWREEHEAKLEAQRKQQEEQMASGVAMQNQQQQQHHQQQQQHQQHMSPYGDPNAMNQGGMQQPPQQYQAGPPMGGPTGMGPSYGLPLQVSSQNMPPSQHSGYPSNMMYPHYQQRPGGPPGSGKHVVLGPNGMPQQVPIGSSGGGGGGGGGYGPPPTMSYSNQQPPPMEYQQHQSPHSNYPPNMNQSPQHGGGVSGSYPQSPPGAYPQSPSQYPPSMNQNLQGSYPPHPGPPSHDSFGMNQQHHA